MLYQILRVPQVSHKLIRAVLLIVLLILLRQIHTAFSYLKSKECLYIGKNNREL